MRSESVGTNSNSNLQHNFSSFYSVNYLDETVSYLERTAKKLIPILKEVKKRMIQEKKVIDSNDSRWGGVNNKD
jgi:hypothetical protein